MTRSEYTHAHNNYTRARVAFITDLTRRAEKIGFATVSRQMGHGRAYCKNMLSRNPSHDIIVKIADAIEGIERKLEAIK